MGKKSAPVVSETLAPGDGVTFPSDGDILTVHYTGTLLADGTEFDSSRAKNKPFSFVLGAGKVIKGWELGLAAMSLGQRSRLTISADAAYGKRGCNDKANASGTGVIPPHADLVFDVILLDINDQRGVATTAKLDAYMRTLEEWVASKMAKFDSDAAFAAGRIAKFGSREGFLASLEASKSTKFEAERAKAAESRQAREAASQARETEGVATAQAARTNEVLRFDERFATIKVDPKPDEDEPNFPRNLHNAAELFGATRRAAR